MNPLKVFIPKPLMLNQDELVSSEDPGQQEIAQLPFKKIRGGFLMLLGYALSPLCWWNDLIFNLPIAYAVGYLCGLVSSNWFIPGAIAGYWLSNVVGILLMQAGFLDVVQGQAGDPSQVTQRERNLKKELLTGVVSSTLYTVAIVLLLHFKVLETPLLSFHP